MEALLVETGIHGWLYDVNAFKVLQFQSVTLSGGQRKVPSMTKSDLIVTNIAISVNKSALLVNKSALSVQKSALSVQKKCIFSPKKCPFSPLLSALLKTEPPRLPFGPSGTAAPMSFTKWNCDDVIAYIELWQLLYS